MNTLKSVAEKYIESENKYGDQKALYHYNCAEVLLNSCNDYFNLGLDYRTLKAIVPFGAGFYSERSCGALTGGLAAIGILFSEDKPTSNDKLKEITKKWVKAFEEEFGDLECKDIKAVHRHPEKGCGLVVARAAELLQAIIEEYENLED